MATILFSSNETEELMGTPHTSQSQGSALKYLGMTGQFAVRK